MFGHVKELIVILVIAGAVFGFAKPVALRFTAERDFVRRRNVWFALTVTAFLSPTFWPFAFIAMPLLLWAGRKDNNPAALYLLLLQVIPYISIQIPVIGINKLFGLDNYRLLSFFVLIPLAWRIRHAKNPARILGLQTMDVFLLMYGVVQVALFIPPDLPNHVILHDSPTNLLRRAVLFFVDIYFLYFAVSRSCANRESIVDAEAAFCVSSIIMAVLAVFETLRHWLLYAALAPDWSGNDFSVPFTYLARGNMLRAEASAGHPLALGFLLAIALGLWISIQSRARTRRSRVLVVVALIFGLLATYSRGPWLGAIFIFIAFSALGSSRFSRLLKAGSVIILLAGVISMSPLRAQLIKALPLPGGPVDTDFTYRQRLLDQSLQLIEARPLFGDQSALSKMQNLRQGQGIIDVVNSYIDIALFHGLVGLALFLGFILTALNRAYRAAKAMIHTDAELALLGFGLVACILGALLMMADISFILGIEKMFYVLAALAAAYAHCARESSRRPLVHSHSDRPTEIR